MLQSSIDYNTGKCIRVLDNAYGIATYKTSLRGKMGVKATTFSI